MRSRPIGGLIGQPIGPATRSKRRTHHACHGVSTALGSYCCLTQPTASFLGMPSSTANAASAVPVLPRPPRQATSTTSPSRARRRTSLNPSSASSRSRGTQKSGRSGDTATAASAPRPTPTESRRAHPESHRASDPAHERPTATPPSCSPEHHPVSTASPAQKSVVSRRGVRRGRP